MCHFDELLKKEAEQVIMSISHCDLEDMLNAINSLIIDFNSKYFFQTDDPWRATESAVYGIIGQLRSKKNYLNLTVSDVKDEIIFWRMIELMLEPVKVRIPEKTVKIMTKVKLLKKLSLNKK